MNIGTDINTRPHTELYVDLMWQEYYKMKEELEMERSKRKQIEELYDNLKADVAPLIKAAKELNESYEDAYAVNKVRRAVKYL